MNLKATGIFKFPLFIWILFTLALTSSYTAAQGFYYILLLIYIISLVRNRRAELPPYPYTGFFALFAFSAIISIVFAIDFRSALEGRDIIVHLIIVFIVCNSRFDRESFLLILYTFFSGTALSSVYAIFQKLSGMERVTGFFGDYQTLAGILSISILVLSAYLIDARVKCRKASLAIWTVLVLNMAALFFTYTRSALIGLVFGLVLLFYLKAKWTLPVFLSVVFLLLGIALQNPKSEIGDLVLSIMFPRDRASSRFIVNKDRIDMYGDSIKIAGEYPVTGIGFETLAIVYHDPDWDLSASKNYTRISSNYLNMLVSAGIPGLVSYLLFIGATLWVLAAASGSIRDHLYHPFILGVMSCLVFTMVSGLFEPVFFDPKVRFLMYYFIGLAFLFYIDSRRVQDTTS